MTRRYTTIAEPAEYLQISDRTVRRLIAGRELTGYRTGPPGLGRNFSGSPTMTGGIGFESLRHFYAHHFIGFVVRSWSLKHLQLPRCAPLM